MKQIDHVQRGQPGYGALKTLTGLLAVSLLVAACGVPETPNESIVKDEVKSAFANCGNVTIKDFKYHNGTEMEKPLYLTHVSFTVEVEPNSENVKLYKDSKAKYEALEPEVKKLETRLEAMNEQLKGYDRQLEEVQHAFWQLPDNQRPPNTMPRDLQQYKEIEQQKDVVKAQVVALSEANAPLTEEYAKYYRRMVGGGDIRMTMYRNFYEQCKINTNDRFVVSLMSQVLSDTEKFAETAVSKFESDIVMRKTDKGWVMQSSWRK